MAHVYCAFSKKLNINSFERGEECGLLVKIGWSDAERVVRQDRLRKGYKDSPALAGKGDWIIEEHCWWDVGEDQQVEDDVLGWFRRRRCGFYRLYWPLRINFKENYPQLKGCGGLTEVMLIRSEFKLRSASWRSSLTLKIIGGILAYVFAQDREWAVAERVRHLKQGRRLHVSFQREGVTVD